jgi:hypothetical protein
MQQDQRIKEAADVLRPINPDFEGACFVKAFEEVMSDT